MSAIGTKRTYRVALHMSAFGRNADGARHDFPVLQFGKMPLAPVRAVKEV